MEDEVRAGMSTINLGTKTGNKEKRKASNYIWWPVEKWHWLADKRTEERLGRQRNMEDSSPWCPSVLEISLVSQVIPGNSTVPLSLITIKLIFNFTLLLCFLLKIINWNFSRLAFSEGTVAATLK